jgi:hypothetical protein
MDVKVTGWYGRLKIDGIAGATKLDGSIVSMLGQIMLHLTQAKARTNGEGSKIITITLSDAPITDDSIEIAEAAAKLEAAILAEGIEIDYPKPLDGEDMLTMAQRLQHAEGYNAGTAMFHARDAFGYGPDPDLAKWQADSKVRAFIRLNASDRAVEQADPQEYQRLKNYTRETYPKFYAMMTIRG